MQEITQHEYRMVIQNQIPHTAHSYFSATAKDNAVSPEKVTGLFGSQSGWMCFSFVSGCSRWWSFPVQCLRSGFLSIKMPHAFQYNLDLQTPSDKVCLLPLSILYSFLIIRGSYPELVKGIKVHKTRLPQPLCAESIKEIHISNCQQQEFTSSSPKF